MAGCVHCWHLLNDERTEDGVRQTYERCCFCNAVHMVALPPDDSGRQGHGPFIPLAPGEKRPRRRLARQ